MRDACIFAFKMWLDGLKDVLIAFVGLAAAAVDLVRGPQPRGFRFYQVMRVGERIDEALDLYDKKRLPPDDLGHEVQ